MLKISKYNTKENLLILTVLIFFSFFWLYFFLNFSTLWAQDSFWYSKLAENLATGKGFTTDGANPHAQYPIGLPLLIVPLYFLTGSAPYAGLILVLILSLASIILSYKIGKEINMRVGIISAIILSSHNLFLFNSLSLMTEIPFMFFSVLGLYLFMKSYENRTLIIPAIISISFSILIRYDGFFLIFPMLFYMIYRRKDFEEFFFSKKTFLAIGLGGLILFAWFIRNIIAFGKPLINAHSNGDGSLGLSVLYLLEFFSYFRFTGYLFPILSIVGILFILFKAKNLELKTFLVWIIIYLLFHSWWWARAFRFYGQILILFCIFSAIALDKIYKLFFNKRKLIGKIVIALVLFLILLEQIAIFSFGSINHETTVNTLNRYDPIKNACEYANKYLPEDATYVFPEEIVYTSFLKKSNMASYSPGLNYLFSTNSTIYFFTDNLHSWITTPFIPVDGKIFLSVQTTQGTDQAVIIYPVLISNFEKSSGKKTINSTIYRIDGFHLI